MDRDALLLYLQNVRDLEVARYWLQKQYQEKKRDYEKRKTSLLKVNYCEEPSEPGGLGRVFWIYLITAIGDLIVALWLHNMSHINYGIHRAAEVGVKILIGLAVIFGIVALVSFLSHRQKVKEYEYDFDRAVEQNEAEERRVNQNRVKEIPKLEANWESQATWYQQELEKLDALLKDFYDMNVLPVQFRELPAVCYIYDYMSTSQEPLTTALFGRQIEDGIRRIEAKLDTIISNLKSIVYETRCLRQNAERTIAQNSQMLDSLQRAETNTLQAAQYAELSANYSKANEYFSLATYLKV